MMTPDVSFFSEGGRQCDQKSFWKNRPKSSPAFLHKINTQLLLRKNVYQTFWLHLIIFPKNCRTKTNAQLATIRPTLGHPGDWPMNNQFLLYCALYFPQEQTRISIFNTVLALSICTYSRFFLCYGTHVPIYPPNFAEFVVEEKIILLVRLFCYELTGIKICCVSTCWEMHENES
jgi:hypothetical protein